MSLTENKEIALLKQILIERTPPSSEEISRFAEETDVKDAEFLFENILKIRDILKNFSAGNFDDSISIRGILAGYLKTLQANLRHLTWQVEQVATGDLTQRVDFMGDFSKAFNSLTSQLEQSLEEQKEREANERTQIMLDATPLACCFWDDQFNRVDCNLEALKLFEINQKQEFLDRFEELSPQFQPNGRLSSEYMLEKLKEASRKGKIVFEWMHQTIDKRPIPVEIIFVRVQRGDQYNIAGYARDLRELKQTQDALERERLLLLDILNSSPVCFAILVHGQIRFATPFMQDFLGVNLGDYLIDYFKEHDIGWELMKDLQAEQIIHWRPVSMRTKSGEPKEMLASVFLMDYYDEKGVMAWLIDVTKIRQVEADLRKARDVAEDLSRVKSEFLANMSHEIRTPMNAILGMMHLVKATKLSGKQLKYIETTEDSAKLLLRIINDILDFSKIEANRLEIDRTDFSVKLLVQETVAYIKEEASKRKLSVICDIAPDIPSRLFGDPVHLKQILLNLLGNAVKFTPSGEIRITAELKAEKEKTVTLLFSVKDTGIGMSEKTLRQLFTPFTQADASSTRKYGGTGLGLAISKSLVELMGGEIRCESHENQGSKFVFSIEFEKSVSSTLHNNQQNEVEASASDELSAIPEHLLGASILLAEDNLINQLVATELLKSKGFQVDVASTGKKAIEMLLQKDYLMILMDMQMPEMDGLEATRKIRQMPQYTDLPILAMTANAMAGDREMCLEAGMNDHIAKPIDPKILFNRIVQWSRKADSNSFPPPQD